MKSQLDELQGSPSLQIPLVNGDELGLTPILEPEQPQKDEQDLLLIAGLVEQEPVRQAPPPLIQRPELIVTPDRDARFRPPSGVTTEILDQIAQHARRRGAPR